MLVPSLARAGETAPAIRPVPSHPIDRPIAPRAALDRGAKLILKAERPLVMLGVTASRPHLADSLSYFVKHLQIPFFNTQMGKHSVAGGLYMAPLRSRNGTMCIGSSPCSAALQPMHPVQNETPPRSNRP
jgi:thiamine pyrophosphate-dependent acetolactate synthase large subunit-like protein